MPPDQLTAKKIDVCAHAQACRLTGSELLPFFDLGMPCVSDFVEVGVEGIPAPLCVAVAKEAPYLAQLTHSYPPEQMYRRYHYRSGTNEAMRAELADVVAKAQRLRPVRDGEGVLDIASNDGTLLKCWGDVVPPHRRIGIDPSDVARDGPLMDYHLANDFFSVAAYRAISGDPAAVVTCIACFYDIESPVDFLKDVRSVLADDGLFVLQVAYTPMHVRRGAWDGICHEHLTYWDYRSLKAALVHAGLAIVDAEITASNGGSIRIYSVPAARYASFKDTVEGAAANVRRRAVEVYDQEPMYSYGANTFGAGAIKDAWCGLANKAARDRADLRRFLHDAKCEGKTVVGLGASTKGNTILQWCGIGPDLLPCIADRQEHKHGLVTAGSNIPIVSEEEARRMKPDYLLALPWFFADSLRQREAALIMQGTKLVLPLPKLTILP